MYRYCQNAQAQSCGAFLTGPDMNYYCQTSDLGLRLEVDFVFPLSQQEQQEEEQPLTKI